MMFVDTHVVVWLYYGEEQEISKKAKKAIEDNDLFISPIVELELQFLNEIGKFTDSSRKIIEIIRKEFGVKIYDESFASIIKNSVQESWTRDPFDRIIVGQAKALDSALLTRDKKILNYFSDAVW